jgi:hypothetical protein
MYMTTTFKPFPVVCRYLHMSGGHLSNYRMVEQSGQVKDDKRVNSYNERKSARSLQCTLVSGPLRTTVLV